MTTLGEYAKEYEPQQTKNIVELEAVSVDMVLEERTGTDKEGKDFKYNVVVVDKEEYRIPNSVIASIKAIQEVKPTLKTVKVTKKGQGLNTEYTVIPLE